MFAPPTQSLWISGPARSGKTAYLVEQFCRWGCPPLRNARNPNQPATTLVFAANGDNRMDLSDRLAIASRGQYALHVTTPLGFFQEEVVLFWPLIAQQLQLKTPFPLRLRPETEQELATRLWQPELRDGRLRMEGVSAYFVVRRALDLYQLATLAEIPLSDMPLVLEQGFGELPGSGDLWSLIGELLQRWRQWCLERGLLTYSLVVELYGQTLLPHPDYQRQFQRRYGVVLADDVEDYPAIARTLFEGCLDLGMVGAFTYNPDGAGRLGLGADPEYLSGLAMRCQEVSLQREKLHPPVNGSDVRDILLVPMLQLLQDPQVITPLPSVVQSIQTTSRGQLLRQTAEIIISAVGDGAVKPEDIAIIAPGMDAIVRYSFTEILMRQGIGVRALSTPRPLVSNPVIRSLLTLLGLVYPGLGRWVERDGIAEMLVVFSLHPQDAVHESGTRIDPVRGGLLADYCFEPHPEHPRLLPAQTFPRWDRLGYQATQSYEAIYQWIEIQKTQYAHHLLPSAIALLDRAIQHFLWQRMQLAYDQLAALRELMETAQHYWEVDGRLSQHEPSTNSPTTTVGRFIDLLRSGTITADPYPVQREKTAQSAVTLATIFQYRANRGAHRWHFWLDAGSNLWLTGGRGLYGSPLMLRHTRGTLWTTEQQIQADDRRLREQLTDLLGRVEERVYLCHSDLATNGQEQAGPLLSLINATVLAAAA